MWWVGPVGDLVGVASKEKRMIETKSIDAARGIVFGVTVETGAWSPRRNRS